MTGLKTLSDLVQIKVSLHNLADHMRELDTGGTFNTMTCSEVESLAEVVRYVDPECADFIIAQHAEHDEPGDQHFIIPEDAACNQCGRQDRPITLTDDWGYMCDRHVGGPPDDDAEPEHGTEVVSL